MREEVDGAAAVAAAGAAIGSKGAETNVGKRATETERLTQGISRSSAILIAATPRRLGLAARATRLGRVSPRTPRRAKARQAPSCTRLRAPTKAAMAEVAGAAGVAAVAVGVAATVSSVQVPQATKIRLVSTGPWTMQAGSMRLLLAMS